MKERDEFFVNQFQNLILSNIGKYGITNKHNLPLHGMSAADNLKPDLDPQSRPIYVNRIDMTSSESASMIYNSIYSGFCGAYEIAMERNFDIELDVKSNETPKSLVTRLFQERIKNSVLFVLKDTVGQSRGWHTEREIQSCPVEDILAILTPKHLTTLVENIFSSKMVIPVKNINAKVSFNRPFTLDRIKISSSLNEEITKLKVPAYKRALKDYLKKNKLNSFLTHIVRLPIVSDVPILRRGFSQNSKALDEYLKENNEFANLIKSIYVSDPQYSLLSANKQSFFSNSAFDESSSETGDEDSDLETPPSRSWASPCTLI